MYLTYRTIQGQNNSINRPLKCHGCDKYKSPVILIQGKESTTVNYPKDFQLCLNCLDDLNSVVQANIAHKVLV